jgi:hypothetical protein
VVVSLVSSFQLTLLSTLSLLWSCQCNLSVNSCEVDKISHKPSFSQHRSEHSCDPHNERVHRQDQRESNCRQSETRGKQEHRSLHRSTARRVQAPMHTDSKQRTGARPKPEQSQSHSKAKRSPLAKIKPRPQHCTAR